MKRHFRDILSSGILFMAQKIAEGYMRIDFKYAS